jgi:hypothetical protein
MFVHPCEFFCCFRKTLHVARNTTETALERHGVDRRLWCDILCAAGSVEAVFSGRFELVVQTLQETKIAHAQWACILNTSAVVEAIYAKSLAATLKLLGNIPHDAWTGILRSRAASAAVAQNCFPEITAAMVLAPVPLWACILSTRGALQAVYRRNLTRVTEALAEVEPELWAQIMDSDGFAQAVAQDDVAQITGALQHVPGRFWADILNTNGAFESIYWRNFPELTASLHKHKVPMDDWASFLHMSTQEVYDALYNDASSWQ